MGTLSLRTRKTKESPPVCVGYLGATSLYDEHVDSAKLIVRCSCARCGYSHKNGSPASGSACSSWSGAPVKPVNIFSCQSRVLTEPGEVVLGGIERSQGPLKDHMESTTLHEGRARNTSDTSPMEVGCRGLRYAAQRGQTRQEMAQGGAAQQSTAGYAMVGRWGWHAVC